MRILFTVVWVRIFDPPRGDKVMDFSVRLVAACPPLLKPHTHTHSHTHSVTHTTAHPLAVNHGLTCRTGDRPVIKPRRYHSSSHLYSPPPYTSLCRSLAFSLSQPSSPFALHPMFLSIKSPFLSSLLSPKSSTGFIFMPKHQICGGLNHRRDAVLAVCSDGTDVFISWPATQKGFKIWYWFTRPSSLRVYIWRSVASNQSLLHVLLSANDKIMWGITLDKSDKHKIKHS